MSTLTYFPIKLCDTEPPFEVILQTGSAPVDLTGVTAVRVAYRREASEEWILEKEAEVVDPSNQEVGDTDRGRIRHPWDEGDTETLFGEQGSDVELVVLYAEVELIRDGKPLSWPTEGAIEVRVWRDIVENES